MPRAILLALAALVAAAAVAAGSAGAEPGPPSSGCEAAPFARCAGQDLAGSDLGRADLRGADLRGADLGGAFLHGAALVGADLRGANLRAGTLTAADLRDSRLAGANLADANLLLARLSDGVLERAYLCDTRLPGGGLSDRDCERAAPRSEAPPSPRVAAAAARRAPSPGDGSDAQPPAAALVASRPAASPIASGPAPLPTVPRSGAEPAAMARTTGKGPRATTARRGCRPGKGRADRSRRGRRHAKAPCRRRHPRHHRRRGRRSWMTVRVLGAGWVVAGVARRGGRVVARGHAIACPSRCRRRYPIGTRLVLTATPQPGYAPAVWSGNGCRGEGRRCRVRVRGKARRNRITVSFATVPAPRQPASHNPPAAAPPGGGESARPPGAACPVPQAHDSDGDGLPDCMELTGWQLQVRTPQDLSGTGDRAARRVDSDPHNPDTDGDGLDDGEEFAFNADPRSGDTDRDGLADGVELHVYRSLPNDADSDGDARLDSGSFDPRLFDGNEVRHLRTSPRLPDTDGDGLTDLTEVTREGTNPRVADLPDVTLLAQPGLSDPQLSLDYTVEEATGSEKEHARATGNASSVETSTATSEETTRAHSNEYEAGGECTVSAKPSCSAHFNYKRTDTESVTHGSTSGFSNTRETSQTAEDIARTSAERRVTLGSTGCVQVVLRLQNTGPVAVSIGNIQALAFTADPDHPGQSRLLTTLLPIQGSVIDSSCPATDPGFGPVQLPPGGHADVGFGQLVDTGILLDYMQHPSPIQYRFGPITMTGTNLDGEKEDFLGDVATKVGDRTAEVEVNFGDGTIRDFEVAAASQLGSDGRPVGVTLGEALGPALGDFSPRYTGQQPATVASLRNPETGEEVANAADPSQGTWTLFGDAEGTGEEGVDWRDVVLRPGDTVSLFYAKDADGDGLTDAAERQIGTDPERADTDGDGLDDHFEAREGWTVPFARGDQSDYRVFPSPLSCDADGDGSPDGPGAGNQTYGVCPDAEFAPESERETDPDRADTNEDGLLDGEQGLPEALRAVPEGGRVPRLIRHWGGVGDLGSAFSPIGIAVDGNQPLTDADGDAAPVDSYVIKRSNSPAQYVDELVKFVGNPRLGPPIPSTAPVFNPDYSVDFPGNGDSLHYAITGVAVAPGSVGSGDEAGSPVIVNYYAADAESVVDPSGSSAFTTFNGKTGADVGFKGVGEKVFGTYGDRPCCITTPVLRNPGVIGNGYLDAVSANQIIVAHGAGVGLTGNAEVSNLLPTRYYGRGDTEARPSMLYGHKPQLGPGGHLIGPLKEGELADPSGIAVDRQRGKVYVADDVGTGSQTGTITSFDLATGQADAFVKADDGTLAGLRGLAIDPEGRYLYAASAHCGVVYKFSSSLSLLATIGHSQCTDEPAPRSFQTPSDVDVDAADGLWVADAGSRLFSFYYYPFGP